MEKSSNLSYRNDLTPSELRVLDIIGDNLLEEIMAMCFRFKRKHGSENKNMLTFAIVLRAKIIEEENDGDIERGTEGYLKLSQEHIAKGIEIAHLLSTEWISEKDLEMGLKLARGRTRGKERKWKKMGGRKSRIELILEYLQDQPFTSGWYRDMKYLEEEYAKSTIYEALKMFLDH